MTLYANMRILKIEVTIMELSKMREEIGLTQSELAAISGVNLRSLQDYEQGHKSIASAKGETLMRLSCTLGYSVEDILRDSCSYIGIENGDEDSMRTRIMAYEKMLADRKKKEVHFPIIEADDYVDMSRIYPTKQAYVKRVLSELRFDKRVTSLRLFGSSISMACHKESDIDFAVGILDQSNKARNAISESIQAACNWKADIIWMDHLNKDDRIYSDIMKGVVLI